MKAKMKDIADYCVRHVSCHGIDEDKRWEHIRDQLSMNFWTQDMDAVQLDILTDMVHKRLQKEWKTFGNGNRDFF